MTYLEKLWVIFLLFLIFIFGFYGGKYQAWESDPTKQTSKGFFSDWQVAIILGLITIIGAILYLPKK